MPGGGNVISESWNKGIPKGRAMRDYKRHDVKTSRRQDDEGRVISDWLFQHRLLALIVV